MNSEGKYFGKFLLLWSGELISTIGNGITSFGLGIYVFELTGRASAMALVSLLAFMPSILLGALAGILADRYDRRILMIIGDSFSAVGLIFILLCMFYGEAQVWQICVGVTISSVFSALLEPAYRATITDLLTKEQFTRASGLVQMAGSAKFLISPLIAGFLLLISDIKLLLIIDICTFLVTATSTLVVRKGLVSKIERKTTSFIKELEEGWIAISLNRGVLILAVMGSVITFFVGVIQTLSMPMLLAFTSSTALGMIEAICASGMLVSSILLGIIPIKKGYVKMLSLSLFAAGIAMAVFGLRENRVLICIFGFLFFAMLPFANTALDYLIRTNIQNRVQGRVWGLIGIISQLGYVLAFATSGVLADYVFTPLLVEGGKLVNSIGKVIGTGSGRGIGFLIIIAGILLCITSIALYHIKSIRELERGGAYVS